MIDKEALQRLMDEKKKVLKRFSMVTGHLNFHDPKSVRAGLTRIDYEVTNIIKEGVAKIEPIESNISAITELLDSCQGKLDRFDLLNLHKEGNPLVSSWIEQNYPEINLTEPVFKISSMTTGENDYEGSGSVGKRDIPNLD